MYWGSDLCSSDLQVSPSSSLKASAASVHCVAPQTANRTIRNTAAIWPQRILSFTLASHDGCPASQPDAPAAPERPVDGAARRHRSGDMLAKIERTSVV